MYHWYSTLSGWFSSAFWLFKCCAKKTNESGIKKIKVLKGYEREDCLAGWVEAEEGLSLYALYEELLWEERQPYVLNQGRQELGPAPSNQRYDGLGSELRRRRGSVSTRCMRNSCERRGSRTCSIKAGKNWDLHHQTSVIMDWDLSWGGVGALSLRTVWGNPVRGEAAARAQSGPARTGTCTSKPALKPIL